MPLLRGRARQTLFSPHFKGRVQTPLQLKRWQINPRGHFISCCKYICIWWYIILYERSFFKQSLQTQRHFGGFKAIRLHQRAILSDVQSLQWQSDTLVNTNIAQRWISVSSSLEEYEWGFSLTAGIIYILSINLFTLRMRGCIETETWRMFVISHFHKQ